MTLHLWALPALGCCVFVLLGCVMTPFCALFPTQPPVLRTPLLRFAVGLSFRTFPLGYFLGRCPLPCVAGGKQKVTWWHTTLAFAARKSFCESHLYPSCCLEIPSTHISLCGAPSDSSKLLSFMLPLSPGLLFFGATRSHSFHCLLGKGSVIIF